MAGPESSKGPEGSKPREYQSIDQMSDIWSKIETHLVGSTSVSVFQPRFGQGFKKEEGAYTLGSISYNPSTGSIVFPGWSIDVSGSKVPNKEVALVPNGRGTLVVYYREAAIGPFKKTEIFQDWVVK